ncbi:MAG: hypothetical protein PHS44_06130 [Candidatus Dojkabacteria bacterium]|jgi:hypothetical protein|nr:hypothetical protein [Candidatus Dojkabacteria bacterium]
MSEKVEDPKFQTGEKVHVKGDGQTYYYVSTVEHSPDFDLDLVFHGKGEHRAPDTFQQGPYTYLGEYSQGPGYSVVLGQDNYMRGVPTGWLMRLSEGQELQVDAPQEP